MHRKVRGGADSGVLSVDDEHGEKQRGAAWSPQTVNAHLGDTPLGTRGTFTISHQSTRLSIIRAYRPTTRAPQSDKPHITMRCTNKS